MTLPEYLKALSDEQKEAFAARLRALRPENPLLVPIHYLYLLEREDRTPAPGNCWMYVEASNGAVTLPELRPELWGSVPAGMTA